MGKASQLESGQQHCLGDSPTLDYVTSDFFAFAL